MYLKYQKDNKSSIRLILQKRNPLKRDFHELLFCTLFL